MTVHPFDREPLCILGPTASGKSSVAMALAERVPNVELVSIDSMQVYREMNIGTAKPTAVELLKLGIEARDVVESTLEVGANGRKAPWELKGVDNRPQIQSGPADKNRNGTASSHI